jgi:predicted anti-sigma-YlaC factor YlaD
MRCSDVRTALSATLDGESTRTNPSEVDDHLLGCASCREWEQTAHVLARNVRLQPSIADLALTRIDELASAMELEAGNRRRSAREWKVVCRCVLGTIAVAQFGAMAPMFLFGHSDTVRDFAAMEITLGVAFLLTALQPSRAPGLVAVTGVGVLLLIVVATLEVLTHRTEFPDESPHLIALIGWLLMWRLAAWAPSEGGGRGLRSLHPVSRVIDWVTGSSLHKRAMGSRPHGIQSRLYSTPPRCSSKGLLPDGRGDAGWCGRRAV